jgi:alkylated DNA repair dioxygenase AlkB
VKTYQKHQIKHQQEKKKTKGKKKMPKSQPKTSSAQVMMGKLFARGAKDVDLESLERYLEDETGKTLFGQPFTKQRRRTGAFLLKKNSKPYYYSKKTREHHEAPQIVKEIAEKVQDELKKAGIDQVFNTAIFTKYLPPSKEDPNDKGDLNWHDDQSGSNLVKNSVVASVVFGEARSIFLRRKDDHKDIQEFVPGDGYFYAMLPGCQKTHQHRVKAGKGVRYSFTFRTTKN